MATFSSLRKGTRLKPKSDNSCQGQFGRGMQSGVRAGGSRAPRHVCDDAEGALIEDAEFCEEEWYGRGTAHTLRQKGRGHGDKTLR